MDRVAPTAAPIKQLQELAQVGVGAPTSETIGDVTHPDTRGTDVTILDRAASSKTAGVVSYQLFFDAVVDAIVTKEPAVGDFTNGLYDEDTHVCAFRFRWNTPLTSSSRYMIAVTHDCETTLTPPIGGFRFIISLPTGEPAGYNLLDKKPLVSSSHKAKFNPHIETAVNDGVIAFSENVSTITFEIANESAAAYNRFAILLPADYVELAEEGSTDDDGAWTYKYEVLSAAPYSA